jgi:hypothetical protein
MIAAELARRFEQGESKSALARQYGMSWERVSSILTHMDAAGPRCVRCQILLACAPTGDAGLCGWCRSENG